MCSYRADGCFGLGATWYEQSTVTAESVVTRVTPPSNEACFARFCEAAHSKVSVSRIGTVACPRCPVSEQSGRGEQEWTRLRWAWHPVCDLPLRQT